MPKYRVYRNFVVDLTWEIEAEDMLEAEKMALEDPDEYEVSEIVEPSGNPEVDG